jgi:ribose-phosphate pyrophosphokinase
VSAPLLFAGTGNRPLAERVAGVLETTLAPCAVERFPDGELSVSLGESVRAREVFVLQPTSPPVNDRLVELLAFADACRRGAAARLTAVVPYFGYARADKRKNRREPVMARVAADLLQAAGVHHLLALDVHTPQVEGFFAIPVDNLGAVGVLADALRGRLADDAVVVSPDLGAVARATQFALRLGLPTAVVHKRRLSGAEVETVQVIGDVRGRACLLVDDMISTGGTIEASVRALAGAGARPDFTVAATHAVFAAGAPERLAAAGVGEIVVTDSVALPAVPPGVRVTSVAPLLAGAIRHLSRGESLHDLF